MAERNFKKTHLFLLVGAIAVGWVGLNGYQRAKENADDSVRFAYTRSMGGDTGISNLLYREELDRAVEAGSINVVLHGRERKAEVRLQDGIYQVWDDDIDMFVDLPLQISSDDYQSVIPDETRGDIATKRRRLFQHCEDIVLASLDEEQREYAIQSRTSAFLSGPFGPIDDSEEESRERIASAVGHVGENPEFDERCIGFSPVPEAKGLWPF